MVRHIVWWTLKEKSCGRTAEENIEHLVKASAVLHGIPNILSLELSANILPSSTVGAQLALMSTHMDREALDNYLTDPVHVEFAREVMSHSQSRNCLNYEIEEE